MVDRIVKKLRETGVLPPGNPPKNATPEQLCKHDYDQQNAINCGLGKEPHMGPACAIANSVNYMSCMERAKRPAKVIPPKPTVPNYGEGANKHVQDPILNTFVNGSKPLFVKGSPRISDHYNDPSSSYFRPSTFEANIATGQFNTSRFNASKFKSSGGPFGF